MVTMVVTMRTLQLREAKARLSAAVDAAIRGEACVITRHGRRTAVVVGYGEWERLSHVPSFGRLLMAAPFTKGDLPKRGSKASGPQGVPVHNPWSEWPRG